ncbi:MAG: ComF family protein [Oscillospiraceae bacterium]|nr:ComF family protein [Candidatus Limimonas coprohippi]MCQ2488083.1 hypothetical protein [Clostridia bacterium]
MLNFKSETERFLSVIYPERCIACGCYLTDSNETDKVLLAHYFCNSCSKEVSWLEERIEDRYAFDKIAIPLEYSGAVREAILRLKFNSDLSSSQFFSREVERAIRTNFYGVKFDIFTCVPSTKKSVATRGYNQSQLIAEKVRIDAEYDFSLLRKKKTTEIQHLLSAEERKKNIESAYSMSPGRNVVDKTILLIDDIFTTGATCNACARELKFAGASAVYVVCVAKRRWKEID